MQASANLHELQMCADCLPHVLDHTHWLQMCAHCRSLPAIDMVCKLQIALCIACVWLQAPLLNIEPQAAVPTLQLGGRALLQSLEHPGKPAVQEKLAIQFSAVTASTRCIHI